MTLIQNHTERIHTRRHHSPVLLERSMVQTAANRTAHLARRTQLEPKIYQTYKLSWARALFDGATLLRGFLWMTGLRSWAERNALSPRHRKLVFEFESLPAAFHGFRILHLSDLHIDAHPELADRICEQIRDVEVDLCLLTGDYQYETARGQHQAHSYMEQVIDSVKARGGCVGILGNHDISTDVRPLEEMGVRMLVNESIEIKIGDESIRVVGVDDPYDYQLDDLPGAMRDIPDTAFKILLAHTPQLYRDAAGHHVHLYLCGHTHGGQVQIPGFGPILCKAKAPRRYAFGTWQYKAMHGHTSSGVGVSGVVARIFCPPEVGLIELRRSDL